MRPYHHQLPPEASEPIRQAIREALNGDNYFTYPDGLDYLFKNGFEEEEIVGNLITYINNECRIYRMIYDVVGIKYECVLKYSDIKVHVKISKKSDADEDEWFIALNFHDHNTGHPELPY